MIVALVSESMDWSDMFRPPLVEFRVESLNRVCVCAKMQKYCRLQLPETRGMCVECVRSRLWECAWCMRPYTSVCVCERERERNREIWSSVDEAGWSSNTPHAQQGKRSRLTVSCHRHCSSPPLSLLWLWRRMSGWSVSLSLSVSLLLVLSLYLESLLMTLMSAPFSSFSLWLSALRSPKTCATDTFQLI